MTRVNEQRETCSCRVCKSDLAYIVPCDFEDTIDFEIIYTDEEIQQLQEELE